MRALKWSLVILLLIVLVFAGRFALMSIPASIGYSVRSEFASLPENDEALQKWLEVQPGIARVYINREGKVVKIFFIQVRNGRGQPAFPDLEEACAALGYKDQVSPFTDFRDEEE